MMYLPRIVVRSRAFFDSRSGHAPTKMERWQVAKPTGSESHSGGLEMWFRAASMGAGLIFLLSLVSRSGAGESPREPVKVSLPAAAGDLFRIGEMAQAAADLRKAGESFEGVAKSLDGLAGLVETIAKSLATMSSEFDPFGYKTAFRTVGQQAEIIQQQQELIHSLQEREIERLRSENRNLKKELQRLRQSKGTRNGG